MSIETPPPGLDQTATTIQIRKWILTDLKELLSMLLAAGSARVLPPDLVELAMGMQPGGSDPWPRWLLLGVAVRLGLRTAKETLRTHGQSDGSAGRTLLLQYAACLLRDGVRVAFVLSNQTPQAFAANVAHVGLGEELRGLLVLLSAEEAHDVRVREAGVSVVIYDAYVPAAGSTPAPKRRGSK